MKASDPHLTALRPVAARPQPRLHPGWTARQFIVLGEATGSVYFMVSFKLQQSSVLYRPQRQLEGVVRAAMRCDLFRSWHDSGVLARSGVLYSDREARAPVSEEGQYTIAEVGT